MESGRPGSVRYAGLRRATTVGKTTSEGGIQNPSQTVGIMKITGFCCALEWRCRVRRALDQSRHDATHFCRKFEHAARGAHRVAKRGGEATHARRTLGSDAALQGISVARRFCRRAISSGAGAPICTRSVVARALRGDDATAHVAGRRGHPTGTPEPCPFGPHRSENPETSRRRSGNTGDRRGTRACSSRTYRLADDAFNGLGVRWRRSDLPEHHDLTHKALTLSLLRL